MLTLHLSWSKKSQISFIFGTAAITFSGRQFLKGSLTWQNILLVTCKIERICYMTSNQMQTDDKRVTSAFSYCAIAVWKFLLICLCKYYLDMQEMNDAYCGDTWIVSKKSSYFLRILFLFLSYNYHDNFKGGKWDLEKLRSQILLTDLKILWCRVMMSCFGCISLELEYQTINIDISLIFQTGSWHLRFPHSPPLISQYISAMIWLYCQVNGH